MSSPLLGLLVCLACACFTRDAYAQLRPTTVVVQGSPEFVDRVRGQVADLDVVIVIATAPDRDAARLRVRAETVPDGLRVTVESLRDGHVWADRSMTDGESSATLEAAAMVARSGLRDALARPSPPSAAREDPEPTVEAPTPVSREVGSGPTGALQLGWQAGIDGLSPSGTQLPSLAAEVQWRPMALGVVLAGSLPSTLEATRLSLTLFTLRAAAFASVDLLDEAHFGLTLGLELGVAAWWRRTERVAEGGQPSPPAWTASPLVAPRVGFRWYAGELPIGVGIEGGADLVPTRPRFEIRVADTTLTHGELFWLQPWVRATVFVTFGASR